ncbi:MAG TPA: hypothetical protein VF442_14510, partial [Sphingobium sp.]
MAASRQADYYVRRPSARERVEAREEADMIFEQIATSGCQSYLIGCEATRAAVLIDPEQSQVDRYVGLVHQQGVHVRYIIDTHTHADHFSASR